MGARLCTFRGVWIVDSVGVRGFAAAFEQVVRGGVLPRRRLVNVDGRGQRVAQGGATGQSRAGACDVLHLFGRVVARFRACRGRVPTVPPAGPQTVPRPPPVCPQPAPLSLARGAEHLPLSFGPPPAPPRAYSRPAPGLFLDHGGELRRVGAVAPHLAPATALPQADPQSPDLAPPSPTDTSLRSSGPCGRDAPLAPVPSHRTAPP